MITVDVRGNWLDISLEESQISYKWIVHISNDWHIFKYNVIRICLQITYRFSKSLQLDIFKLFKDILK